MIALCLPAHNEKENLEVLLGELDGVLSSPRSPEALVLVFDDGSTDGTFSWLRGCEFSGFEFIVMRSMTRVGKASALNHAITKALELGASSVFMMVVQRSSMPDGSTGAIVSLSVFLRAYSTALCDSLQAPKHKTSTRG